MARDRCDTDEFLGNIFDFEIPSSQEEFKTLLLHKNIKIIQIVSSSNLKPTIYIQDEDEWVVLLKGSAILQIDDKEIELKSGDYIFIPAKTPHKVISTTNGALWLAIHIF